MGMSKIDNIKYALIFSGGMLLSGNVLNAQQNVAQQAGNVVNFTEIDKEVKNKEKLEKLSDRILDLKTSLSLPSGTSEMYATLNPQSINKFLEIVESSDSTEKLKLEIEKFFIENPEFYNEVKEIKLDPEVNSILQEISELPQEEKIKLINEYTEMLRINMEDVSSTIEEIFVIFLSLYMLVSLRKD